jgi:hypothetical protein
VLRTTFVPHIYIILLPYSKTPPGKQAKNGQDNTCLVFSAFTSVGNLVYFVTKKNGVPVYVFPTVIRMNADKTKDLFKSTVPLGATSSGVVRVNDPDMYQGNTNMNMFLFTFGMTDPGLNTIALRAKVGTALANSLTHHTHPRSQPFAHSASGKELAYRSEMVFKYSGDSNFFGENPIHSLAFTAEADAIDLVLDLFDVDGNAVTPVEASRDPGVVAAIYGNDNIEAGIQSLKEAQVFRDSLTGPSTFEPSTFE